MVLDVTCFAEAERLYMLARDTAVHGRPLTTLVLPDVLVSGQFQASVHTPKDVHTQGCPYIHAAGHGLVCHLLDFAGLAGSILISLHSSQGLIRLLTLQQRVEIRVSILVQGCPMARPISWGPWGQSWLSGC